ncbi:4Fe-4S dicluster domain-containing protein [Desulfobacula phenolica]|uniref:Electron transport complex protein RnfC n=1 Tax=Desulfobacula phenolica TaxID=90732 RepID=A0A1H2FCD2_9BACT|nr:4Fe-4S dicluster domain-containing protein [Desulfobacula phenolica]SDU05002.1 electron transport complex protein RnfC [Desulfobacula phenolica]
MIKRSFFTLTQPRLNYDLVEPDPKEPELIPVPSNLILLLNEPINSTKEALIKKGNTVEKGEKLYLYTDSTEYTISPVSGTINTIDTYSDVFGNTSTYLVIKNDQTQTNQITYDLKDNIASADEYLRTLPGAPPLKLLANDDTRIDTIVISCGDTDLLSTTNQYVASKFLDELKQGAQILKDITNVTKLCVTVPENINIQGGFDAIQVLKTSIEYPSNLPAMILKDHLDLALPPGKTPEDIGVCFISAEAAVSLGKAYKTKSAGFEKILTIIGKQGIKYRVKATIGTPIRKIFDAFNLNVSEKDRIIIGGPMKGFSTFTPHHPVQPDMDTVIIQDKKTIPELSDNPCVNCGKCLRICPVNIPVNILVRYLEADQYEEAADKYDLESCIECGLCSYVCTARIPIFQYIRLGKHELFKLRADA